MVPAAGPSSRWVRASSSAWSGWPARKAVRAAVASTSACPSRSPAATYLASIASSSAAGTGRPAWASSQVRASCNWLAAGPGRPGMAAVLPITSSAAATSARLASERIRVTCISPATPGSVTVPIRSRIRVSADRPRPR